MGNFDLTKEVYRHAPQMCEVCEAVPFQFHHFGAFCCNRCRAFFRRYISHINYSGSGQRNLWPRICIVFLGRKVLNRTTRFQVCAEASAAGEPVHGGVPQDEGADRPGRGRRRRHPRREGLRHLHLQGGLRRMQVSAIQFSACAFAEIANAKVHYISPTLSITK